MYKKGENVIVSAMGDSKRGIVAQDSTGDRTKVEVEFKDVTKQGKLIKMTMSFNNKVIKKDGNIQCNKEHADNSNITKRNKNV